MGAANVQAVSCPSQDAVAVIIPKHNARTPSGWTLQTICHSRGGGSQAKVWRTRGTGASRCPIFAHAEENGRLRDSERQHVGMHFSDAQPAMVATIASSSIRLNIRVLITSPSLVFVIGSLRQRAAAPTRQRKTSFVTAQDADAVCTDRHTDRRSVPPAGRLVLSWKCARPRI